MNRKWGIIGLAFLAILVVFAFISVLKNRNAIEGMGNPQPRAVSSPENFKQDMEATLTYAVYENHAWEYSKNGEYDKSIREFKKALNVIENMPGDKWPNLKKEDADRINQQIRIDAQIFSRYGLAEALENTGRYDEALQNVEWLIQNQHVKGKEELLKKRLDGMKQTILQKIGTNQSPPTKEG